MSAEPVWGGGGLLQPAAHGPGHHLQVGHSTAENIYYQFKKIFAGWTWTCITTHWSPATWAGTGAPSWASSPRRSATCVSEISPGHYCIQIFLPSLKYFSPFRYREQVSDGTSSNYGRARQYYSKANHLEMRNGRPFNMLAILSKVSIPVELSRNLRKFS